jgi:hypothetical protein
MKTVIYQPDGSHRTAPEIKKGTARVPFDETLAERTGLEPATPGVTGRYSNQLNYRSDGYFL